MTNSKNSEKSTDSNKVLLAHIEHKKAMGLLVLLLTEEIPIIYDLKYSEGPAELQAKAICEFVLRKFKTLTIDEIREAFELNAAGSLPNRTEFYGKITLNSVGSVLSNFRQHKMNSGQRGIAPTLNLDLNVEAELISDLQNLSRSGDHWHLTKYIDEKWEWLKANRTDFNSDIDEKEVKKLEKAFIEKQSQRKESIIPSKWLKPDIIALSEYKMLKIRRYLEAMVPAYKAKMNEANNS